MRTVSIRGPMNPGAMSLWDEQTNEEIKYVRKISIEIDAMDRDVHCEITLTDMLTGKPYRETALLTGRFMRGNGPFEVEVEREGKPPLRAWAPAVCAECGGRGEVQLLARVVPCSRGCSKP